MVILEGVNQSTTSGKVYTLEPARAVPLEPKQERDVIKDVQALPTNGRKKLEIWREGTKVRVAEADRNEARKY